MTASAQASPLSLIKAALPPLRHQRILDLGCGGGALAGLLAAEGAEVTGVDPGTEAIATARAAVPTATFHQGGAEALPFADNSFDAAVIVNALHHVPADAMDGALVEMRRVLRPGCIAVIIEPLASGNFFEALRTVEDETRVRGLAQDALARALHRKLFELVTTNTYTRSEGFADVAAFLKRIIAVDPARQAIVDANSGAVTAAVLAAASRTADGPFTLDQPIKADVLRKPA